VINEVIYKDANFEIAGQVTIEATLPQHLWQSSDSVQFTYLNNMIGGKVEGQVWHHTLNPGKMQSVPFGIHNVTDHNGGRTAGLWAEGER